MSVAANVARKVHRLPKGRPLSVATFRACGSEGAVRSALARLVARGVLVRVARGMYARPKPNRFFGASLPAPEEVAHAIARASRERLAPHGAEIARRLGLSTQMPTQVVFHTTGRTRRIEVVGTYVHFVHAPEALVRHIERPSAAAVLALRYFGRQHATTEVVRKLGQRVPIEDLLREEGSPVWMRRLFAEFHAGSSAA